jgi:glucose-1-phosphate thymidylyltransferase
VRLVLLAAGFATRLHPLTLDRAKPLLEVGGRPILDHILDCALPLPGLRGLVLVTNARFACDFQAWLAARALLLPTTLIDDGATCEADRLGALADLALALEQVPREEECLVIAGDNLIQIDLAPYLERMRSEGAPVILCRRLEGHVPPGRYGELELDPAGRVTRFREKPPHPSSPWVSTGIYLFPAGLRDRLEDYLASGGHRDAPGHFLEWLAPRQPLYALPLRGRLFDIGTPESLAQARAAFDTP